MTKNDITEIEYQYDPDFQELYVRGDAAIWISGLQAMLYRSMVRCFGKEEAVQQFYEAFICGNENGALSPVAPFQEPFSVQQSI